MKKKKLLSILTMLSMVIAMIFTISVPAFAAVNTGTVTITNLGGRAHVELYKIINLNIKENGSFADPLYLWDTNVANWLKDHPTYSNYVDTNNQNAVTQAYTILDNDNPNTDLDGNRVPDNNKQITQFYQELSKEIRTGNINIRPCKEGNARSDRLTLFDVEQGQYLALASETDNLSQPREYYPLVFNVFQEKNGSINDITVAMKQKQISINKDVDDVTAGVGDVKNYTITTDIPVYPNNVNDIHYVIGDKLSTGLTLNKTSIEVFVKEGEKERKLTENTDYTLDREGQPGKYAFLVTMNANTLKSHPGCNILVKYSAVVNEQAVVSDSNLQNHAYLEFNPDPFNSGSFTTLPVDKQLHTYSIEFKKEDSNGTALKGATFKLLSNKGVELKFTQNAAGDYTLAQDQSDNNTTAIKELSSDINGNYLIKGLDTGTYTLKEVKAPDGYVLPNGEATITLVDGGKEPDGILDTETKAEGLELKNLQVSNAKFTFSVINKKLNDFKLPVTGGTGTLIFTLGGLAVMGAAVYLSVSKKKRNAK